MIRSLPYLTHLEYPKCKKITHRGRSRGVYNLHTSLQANRDADHSEPLISGVN